MTRTFIITVDDDDRNLCPDLPWSATVADEHGNLIGAGEAGLGATPSQAMSNALDRNSIDLEVSSPVCGWCGGDHDDAQHDHLTT